MVDRVSIVINVTIHMHALMDAATVMFIVVPCAQQRQLFMLCAIRDDPSEQRQITAFLHSGDNSEEQRTCWCLLVVCLDGVISPCFLCWFTEVAKQGSVSQTRDRILTSLVTQFGGNLKTGESP